MYSNLPPEAYARELLFKLKINTIPTPVEDICTKLGIELIMTPKITSENNNCLKTGHRAKPKI